MAQNSCWQSRKLSNKVWRLSRPFLGPDFLQSLNAYRDTPFANTPISNYDENLPDQGAIYTRVGPLSVRHYEYAPVAGHNITDQHEDIIKDIGNHHQYILPYNINVRLPYNELHVSDNPLEYISKKVGHHIGRELANNGPMTTVYHPKDWIINKQHVSRAAEAYGQFLYDLMKHQRSLPNTETKPDLLTYLGSYQAENPADTKLLKHLSAAFLHTYPSDASHIFRDYHVEHITPAIIEHMQKVDKYKYPGKAGSWQGDPGYPDFAHVIHSVIPHIIYHNRQPKTETLKNIVGFVRKHLDY